MLPTGRICQKETRITYENISDSSGAGADRQFLRLPQICLVHFHRIRCSGALIGAGQLTLFRHALTVGTALQCVLFILYGCRLSGYLVYRDRKTAYTRRMKGEVKQNDGVSFGAKLAIWISASILYALQTSPVTFRLMNGSGTDALCVIGLLISAAGLTLEATADLQKNWAKKKNRGASWTPDCSVLCAARTTLVR